MTIYQIAAHSLEEIDTPAFAEFVRDAATERGNQTVGAFELLTPERVAKTLAKLIGKTRRA